MAAEAAPVPPAKRTTAKGKRDGATADAADESLAQSAALIGIWGLTFLAVPIFASPALLADDRAETRRPWLPLTIGVAVLGCLALYGTFRLARNETKFVADVRLRIMQPNLQQDEKFNYSAKQRVMNHYLQLSDRASGPQSTGVRDATHLIWPESAFPFLLTREPDALAQIAELLPPGTVLITGAVRAPELARDRFRAHDGTSAALSSVPN